MKTLLFLFIALSHFSFGQDNPAKIYERARYEMAVNGREAWSCRIEQYTPLTSDQMIHIEDTYLMKEGVFKVHFIDDNKTVEIFFFDPVNYEIVQDLARMYFSDFIVSKPIHISMRGGEIHYEISKNK